MAEPTFYCKLITLNPEADNTGKIMAELDRQDLPVEVFAAVDGRQQRPALEAGERFADWLALTRNKKLLTNSELGCYLSHLRAVRQAFDAGAEFVCVLEDDIVVEENFAAVLRAAMAENVDIVRLMALKLRRRKVVKSLLPGVLLTRPERGTLGTQAYLMNRRGMAKFLRHASTIYEAIDHVLDHFYLYDLTSYSVEPHVVYELASPSSIVKQPAPRSVRPNWLQRLAYHPVKLYFSLRRHGYFLTHRRALFPASLPDSLPGKSPRLRGKGEAAKLFESSR